MIFSGGKTDNNTGNRPSRKIIIGVDTGNKYVKTINALFPAGVSEEEKPPVISDSPVIEYEGKYYIQNMDRQPYLKDKTEDERYFVLTLFAIIDELTKNNIRFSENDPTPQIVLALGLPPGHVQKYKDSFVKYFGRQRVLFRYNGQSCAIRLLKVYIMAQGYAAMYESFDKIKNLDRAYIIDIGGYTTDVIQMKYGKVVPDSYFSMGTGMIQLLNEIHRKMEMEFPSSPDEDQIERLLADKEYRLADGMKELAWKCAEQFVHTTLSKIREYGVDLTLATPIFVGGGSIRLEPCIRESKLVRAPIIIQDIKANVKGYEKCTKMIFDAQMDADMKGR